MLEWIVSSCVLIAVVTLLRGVLKGKISLRLQYALWLLVLVRLLIPLSFGDSAMSVGNLTKKAAASPSAQLVSALSETELPRMSYQAAYKKLAKEYADRGIQIENMPLEEYTENLEYELIYKMKGELSLAELVRIIWGCGTGLVAICFLLSNLRLHRSLKKTRILISDSHELPVYLSDAIDTPCLFGLFRPAVYLSAEAIEDEHTQRHAIEHELTHFRHRDNIWAILRSLCLAVHWFNPLVWWAAVLSRNDAELACDESTILRLGEDERAEYGRTLIRLTCESRPALLNTATTMTGSSKSITERIALIVKRPKMAFYTIIAVAVIVTVVVFCTFTGAEKSDTPWNWAQTLSTGEITSPVSLWNSDGSNTTLNDEESAELVEILNTLRKEKFTENTELSGGTPSYGLTVQTADGEYHINESIAAFGSLEMSYGDSLWWIENNELTAFVKSLLSTAEPQNMSAMEPLVEHENTNEMEKWESEHKLYGFSVQADGSYAEIGQQWAEAFVSQYVHDFSDDHPLKSTDCTVLKCELYAQSLDAAPKKLIFNMRFACLAVDQSSFEKWYAGWASVMTSEQYPPQLAGWMEFGNFVVLEQTDAGVWTCADAGSGGYGGWGWLNYEEAGEIDSLVEQMMSGGDGITAELMLRVLPFVNWSDFDSKWGIEGWTTLRQLLDSGCISQGRVYGPEDTRKWSDVYPDDQLYRNLYVMLAVLNSDGEYAKDLTDILCKQKEYDPALFETCLQQLPPEPQEAIRGAMGA